ncbi:MAG: thioredoxin family protein [Pseudomonadales bacterium]
MKNKTFRDRPVWQQFLLLALLLGVALVAERQVQNFLGQRAIDTADLPAQPFEQAMIASAADGKPVLANFSALWCPACRKLELQVFTDPRVRNRIIDGFHYTRIEYESAANRTLFTRYNIGGFPTLLVASNNGINKRESIMRLPLTFDPDEMLGLLNKATTAHIRP